MSSSFKYNLMDNDDFLLISTENDLKKEEDVQINVSNVDENKAVGTTKSPAKNVYFPYKLVIRASHYLIYAAIINFVLYESTVMSRNDGLDNSMIPDIFLEPCNATNVIPLDEIKKLKNERTSVLNEINGIISVLPYNISTFTNEYLSQKLANLTEASTTLKKQLEEQKEIRLICYKMNIEKRCEEINLFKKYLYFYKTYANGIHIYIVAASTLLFISFYYISKARKCELSEEEKKECDRAYNSSNLIFHFHFGWIIAHGINLYFDSCTVENYLGKFYI